MYKIMLLNKGEKFVAVSNNKYLSDVGINNYEITKEDKEKGFLEIPINPEFYLFSKKEPNYENFNKIYNQIWNLWLEKQEKKRKKEKRKRFILLKNKYIFGLKNEKL